MDIEKHLAQTVVSTSAGIWGVLAGIAAWFATVSLWYLAADAIWPHIPVPTPAAYLGWVWWLVSIWVGWNVAVRVGLWKLGVGPDDD